MSTLRTLAILLCALAGGGCRQLQRGEQPIRTTHQYAALGTSYTFRSGKHADPVEEGLSYHLDAGYVIFDGDERRLLGWERARASIEGGLAFSRFDLDPPLPEVEEADIYRLYGGARLEWDLVEVPVTPFLRAGLYGRTHRDQPLDVVDYDQDGRGVYAGGGVVWWATENVGIGPFATYARDVRTNNLTEIFAGLTVVIRGGERLR